jgi:hypothetical protein
MTTAALDNDIVLKGACYDLFESMLAVVPAELSKVGYLGAAPFVIMSLLDRVDLSKRPEIVRDALLNFFKNAVVLEPTVDETKAAAEIEYAAQRKNLQLDVGESQLCVMAITRKIPWLVTGDKRAIRALEALLAEVHLISALTGRVICLEQLIIRAIKKFGGLEIRKCICAETKVDKTLAICFECDNAKVAHDVGETGLQSYITDLRKSANSLLVP